MPTVVSGGYIDEIPESLSWFADACVTIVLEESCHPSSSEGPGSENGLTTPFASIELAADKEVNMGHDLSKLEHHLETLNRRVTELNSIGLTKELLLIIRRPGFTTVAELMLVVNAVESLTHGVEGQIQQSKQLLEAAKQIESKGAVNVAA